MRALIAAASAVLLGACASQTTVAQQTPPSKNETLAPLPAFSIPYTKMVLDNGLTLIVHEDHKAPIVAVDVWYHVGSKDEKPGKTGFAHLFEHLMFNGSEHWHGEYMAPFEKVGATQMNGSTTMDRTAYFENVPTTALDMALWMESDRMGHLAGAITQKTLDEQRGVVQNEKRQDENQPFGTVWDKIQRASFPEGHPYRWQTIGSMADLNTASLDDVKQWFHDYYGAANVTLVLSGDIDPATAKAKVEKYFGDIPAGPPITRRTQWIAPRTESTRETMQDNVPNVRIYKTWNVPGTASPQVDELDLAAQVLGGGKTSRLYQRLVYQDQLADSVSVGTAQYELASMFVVKADVHPGVDPARVEKIIDEEMARFLKDGPTQQELDRVRTGVTVSLVSGAEQIGGDGGTADLLASCQVFTGDPGCVEASLKRIQTVTPEQVRATAQQWLSRGDYTLTVVPYPAYKTTGIDVDRSKGPPQVKDFPDLKFPALQHATLKNGIDVVFARRDAVPMVSMSMMFDAGYAADPVDKPGLSSFAMAMLDEGTDQYDATQIAKLQDDLGTAIGASASLDTASVGMSTLASRMDQSLALYADILRHPSFPQQDMERMRKRWLSAISREKTRPGAMALRVLPPLLYGAGHPYAIPFTGSGTAASIEGLTVDDLKAYQRDWLRPDKAKLIVVGDTTLAELLPKLNAAFGDWHNPPTPAPQKRVMPLPPTHGPRVFLMNRPGAQQSTIIAGRIGPSGTSGDDIALDMANEIFGGAFTSRLNMNLREDKHWAYGASSFLSTAQGPQPFLMYAPVQTDHTADSIKEMLKEAAGYVGKHPATDAEVQKVRDNFVRALPGEFETSGAVLGAMRDIVAFKRPDNYVQTLKQATEGVTDAQVELAAQKLVVPDQLTWVIVGDLSKIEAPIRALNIGPVSVLDEQGKVIR